MIETLSDMPPGVIGFEAKGEVTNSDYTDVLMPAIDEALADHDGIRMVFVVGPEFTGYSAGGVWQDTRLGIEHFTKWKRCALVTDVEWMHNLARMFGWLVPVLKDFHLSDLEAAKAWAAGDDPAPDPAPTDQASNGSGPATSTPGDTPGGEESAEGSS